MNPRHLIASAIIVATTCFAGGALAYDRTITVTTPRGTYDKSVSAGCAGGVCSRDASVTGPKGGTVSRSGSCSAGYWLYGCKSTVTGPKGRSATTGFVGRRRYW
jgi:hypothetical protein